MTKYLGISLHPTLHDLHLDATNNLTMVEDTHAVGQLAKQRLKTYYGEWFMDVEVGQPWFSHQDRPVVGILDTPYREAIAEALIKSAILNTKGIVEMTSFSMEPRFDHRELAVIETDVRTEFDEVVSITL